MSDIPLITTPKVEYTIIIIIIGGRGAADDDDVIMERSDYHYSEGGTQ